jgi:hypothetical protein
MSVHLIPQDKANHEAYGGRIAAVCATLAVLVCALSRHTRPWALLAGGAVALLAVLAAGVLKERLDAAANALAAAAGEPPPHGVERADIVATVRGGVAVALPLVTAAVAQWGRV